MAEAAAIIAGFRWLAPVATDLLKKGYSFIGMDVDEKLQDLQNIIIPQIEMLIEAAASSPHKDSLCGWLKSLEEAVYEAEDVLDLHDYQLLKQKVKSSAGGITVRLESLPPIKYLSKKFSVKLKKSLVKLEKTAAKAREFLLFLPVGVSNVRGSGAANESGRKVTTSLLAHKVFGRDKQRDHIVDLLHETVGLESESSFVKSYSVVAIVGLGGAGKTTLAQYICDLERAAKHFDIIMWIHVSQRFNILKLTSEMLESAFKSKCLGLTNLDTLQRELEDSLRSKKFLLVLDDVWSEKKMTEMMEWEQLLAPLGVGNRGSKILVTNRMKGVAEALGARHILHLEELKQSDFISLFMNYALDDAQIDDTKLYEELKKIVRQSAPKLHGSPLAARMVGSQLRKRLNVDFWKRILNEDLLKDTMKSLLWSYQNLEAHLQRCFSYCSLFPKGREIKRKKLIDLWIAEGFIKTTDKSKRIEDVSQECFDDLLSSSFFLPTKDDSFYTMHDLLHDLAEMVSKERCLRVEENPTTAIPREIRHLSLYIDRLSDLAEKICNLKNLRTLIVLTSTNDDCVDDLLHSIFVKLQKLRVVDLSECRVKNVPESIGGLKHLRYLDLRRSSFEFLPKSIFALYHLEFLRVSNCTSVSKGLTNLINLRHVFGIGQMHMMVAGIGRLASLESLKYFEVKKKRGYELKQLGSLTELRGPLYISGLENVEGKEKGLEAKLEDKERIVGLRLEWSTTDDGSRPSDMDTQVLEGLCPPPQLTTLEIRGYRGRIYPSWMVGERCFLHNLIYLELNQCRQLEVLPDIASSYHDLKYLAFTDLWKLKKLPILPPALTHLVLDACFSLAFFSKEDLEMIRSTQDNRISQVVTFSEALAAQTERCSFHVRDSQGLRNWLEKSSDSICQNQLVEKVQLVLPSSIQQLEITSCKLTDSALWECLRGLNSLTHLKISDIVFLTSLPSAEVLRCLTVLQELEIRECWFLTSLGGLQALGSLQKLIIVSCPNLSVELPARGCNTCLLPPSLTSLRIEAWNSNKLDDLLYGATSLINLEVEVCPFMESLQLGRVTSLRNVSIINCPELKLLLGFQKLEHLTALIVNECPKLATAATKLAGVHLPQLRELTIDDPSLLSLILPVDGHNSLSQLHIMYMRKESFSVEHGELFEHLASLSRLRFTDCSVNSLPPSLERLSSLEYLDIIDCPNIVSLPDLPKSLEFFSIVGCSSVLEKQCQGPNGQEWHKIAHIHCKFISSTLIH